MKGVLFMMPTAHVLEGQIDNAVFAQVNHVIHLSA